MGSAGDYSLEAVWARRILVKLELDHSGEEEEVGSQPRQKRKRFVPRYNHRSPQSKQHAVQTSYWHNLASRRHMWKSDYDGKDDKWGHRWQRMAEDGSSGDFLLGNENGGDWLDLQACLTGRCGHSLLFANGSFAESEDMHNSRAIIIQ